MDLDPSAPESRAICYDKQTGLYRSTPYDVVAKACVEGLAGKVYIVLLCKLLGNIHHLESAQVVTLCTWKVVVNADCSTKNVMKCFAGKELSTVRWVCHDAEHFCIDRDEL